MSKIFKTMDLTKYTNDGLNKLLHKAITDENYELANEIKKQVENRFGNGVFMDKDSQIAVIIDMINFGKIHDVMVTLNWHWASSAFGVPTVEDIIEEAKNLLDKAWGYREGLEHVSYETGGLRAERWIYDGVKLLTLSFVVDSFMIDYDTAKMGKDEFYGDKNVTDE